MTSVIPSDDKAEFRHKCKKLLTVGEVEFFEIAADIQRKWPRTQTWMNWWLIPENAQMLFSCMRKMTPALAAKLPDTTNAEEAMHATIYCGVGKGHTLFDGLNGLLAIEKYYCQQHEAKQCMCFPSDMLTKILI